MGNMMVDRDEFVRDLVFEVWVVGVMIWEGNGFDEVKIGFDLDGEVGKDVVMGMGNDRVVWLGVR